jgi:hypothetical protein
MVDDLGSAPFVCDRVRKELFSRKAFSALATSSYPSLYWFIVLVVRQRSSIIHLLFLIGFDEALPAAGFSCETLSG